VRKENSKKLSVFWAQKFRTRREISVFAKPCKISKRSLKEAKSRRFEGCEFRELIYSNFSKVKSIKHLGHGSSNIQFAEKVFKRALNVGVIDKKFSNFNLRKEANTSQRFISEEQLVVLLEKAGKGDQ